MRIAVDIGFGFVKAMSEEGKKVSFPSVITRRSEASLIGVVGESDDDFLVTYWEDGNDENKKKLFVGDAAMTNGGTRRWGDKEQFNVEELKVFIATAIGLINPENEEIDLCVGLPMSHYIKKKDDLLKNLRSISANIAYVREESIRKIKCKSVFCFPQGAGAYYSAIFDEKGEITDYNLAKSSVGVIDIGYRTVDYLVMSRGRKGINIIDSLSGSLEEDGMNKAFQSIEKAVSNKIGKEIGTIEIEKALLWFDKKLDYRRNQVDLISYEKEAYNELGKMISSKIKQKWGVEGDLLSVIFITGGGGKVLFPIIKEEFEQAELQDDSSYANCKGYLGAQARKIR